MGSLVRVKVMVEDHFGERMVSCVGEVAEELGETLKVKVTIPGFGFLLMNFGRDDIEYLCPQICLLRIL